MVEIVFKYKLVAIAIFVAVCTDFIVHLFLTDPTSTLILNFNVMGFLIIANGFVVVAILNLFRK